ncbi:hypothetical protein GCM10007875_24050 [Limnobacter litoralis]|uniref:Uncharacterized protein n=1 Tax=Limnobacter litoralis TaxID=481366 RepID=A0ABQ5YT49_9BURK|nr:hypothetical protein GCM10007875_24050 [Limnobacter litoralis]
MTSAPHHSMVMGELIFGCFKVVFMAWQIGQMAAHQMGGVARGYSFEGCVG